MLKPWVALFGVALATTARAEPCPIFTPQPEVLGPATVEVTSDGGVIVGMVQKMDQKTGDVMTWTMKGGKQPTLGAAKIAPGLYTIKPPVGGIAYTLVDDKGRTRATAKLAAKPEAKLGPPVISSVVSGTSRGKHPSSFVIVNLKDAAPTGARALILEDAKSVGVALSWGTTTDAAQSVTVYSTESGCVTQFPDGTVMAAPKQTVRAYWIDRYGRRSPASKTLAVTAVP